MVWLRAQVKKGSAPISIKQDMSPLDGAGVLVRSTFWSLAGSCAPICVAIFSIPVIVERLGMEKFGVLTLAWAVIGYFTLFDLGLGRTLTKMVSERLGAESHNDVPALAWTASVVILVLGIVGGIALWQTSPYLMNRVFQVSADIFNETLDSLYLLAAAIPLVISTSGFRGILEAYQRFDLTSGLRVVMGLFTFLGPLAVLAVSRSLFWVTFALVVGRLLVWVCHVIFCFRVVPELRSRVSVNLASIPEMMKFGGWITVSSIVSPATVYLDRFLLGALVSVAAVAYYSTPWEIVTKLLVIPSAIAAVLFPAFSAAMVRDSRRADKLYRQGVKYVFVALFPLALVAVFFAKEGLFLWLGRDFAENSCRLMQLISIGTLIIGIATVPFAFLQGIGRPDLTAKLHIVEVIFYVPCAWWLISKYAALGAAITWVLHAVAEALVLVIVSSRYLHDGRAYLSRQALCFATSIGLLAFGMLSVSEVTRVVAFLVIAVGFILFSWVKIFGQEEKDFVLGVIRVRSKSFLNNKVNLD